MKISTFALLSLCVASKLFGQGEFQFNNDPTSSGPAAITIGSQAAAGEGAVGAFLGSDYTASVFYLPGSGYTKATFDNNNPVLFAGADTQFYGVTGFSPRGDIGNAFVGAGFFDGGVVVLPLPNLTTITVEVRTWYNVGASSYAAALANGFNVGESGPIEIELTVRPVVPQQLEGIQPFTVQAVPEPSSLALALLGLAALMAPRLLPFKALSARH